MLYPAMLSTQEFEGIPPVVVPQQRIFIFSFLETIGFDYL